MQICQVTGTHSARMHVCTHTSSRPATCGDLECECDAAQAARCTRSIHRGGRCGVRMAPGSLKASPSGSNSSPMWVTVSSSSWDGAVLQCPATSTGSGGRFMERLPPRIRTSASLPVCGPPQAIEGQYTTNKHDAPEKKSTSRSRANQKPGNSSAPDRANQSFFLGSWRARTFRVSHKMGPMWKTKTRDDLFLWMQDTNKNRRQASRQASRQAGRQARTKSSILACPCLGTCTSIMMAAHA